jgi:6-methylsalicylate decarboxylase
MTEKLFNDGLLVERKSGLSHCVGRRELLGGLAALGASALVPGISSLAQAPAAAKPFRIDVHYHFASPRFGKELSQRKTGQQALIDWTPSKALDDMDRDGVATSVLSTSEPGVYFGDNNAARSLARDMNEFGARLVADHPTRFGLFAILPLPDVDGALREIEYAFDTLKADGACFMTSYQGKYLGDPAFAPVMDELNRRKAVVYTHPFRAECCINLLPDNGALGMTLVNDTTFTIASVLHSGTASRCPDIRYIWSHGGGTMPYIIGRVGGNAGPSPIYPKGAMYEIQKFYYDTAQAVAAPTLAALTNLIPNSHILFGSDYPFAGARAMTNAEGLRAYGKLSATEIRNIERDNSLPLFPRLKA